MVTGIGEAAGLLALTMFALNASKSLFEAVSSFKNQRKSIQVLQADLGALVPALDLVRQQVQNSENESKFEPLQEPVECCGKTCQEMQEMLDKCIKHAKDGRDSLRDWLKMQYPPGVSFEVSQESELHFSDRKGLSQNFRNHRLGAPLIELTASTINDDRRSQLVDASDTPRLR